MALGEELGSGVSFVFLACSENNLASQSFPCHFPLADSRWPPPSVTLSDVCFCCLPPPSLQTGSRTGMCSPLPSLFSYGVRTPGLLWQVKNMKHGSCHIQDDHNLYVCHAAWLALFPQAGMNNKGFAGPMNSEKVFIGFIITTDSEP